MRSMTEGCSLSTPPKDMHPSVACGDSSPKRGAFGLCGNLKSLPCDAKLVPLAAQSKVAEQSEAGGIPRCRSPDTRPVSVKTDSYSALWPQILMQSAKN